MHTIFKIVKRDSWSVSRVQLSKPVSSPSSVCKIQNFSFWRRDKFEKDLIKKTTQLETVGRKGLTTGGFLIKALQRDMKRTRSLRGNNTKLRKRKFVVARHSSSFYLEISLYGFGSWDSIQVYLGEIVFSRNRFRNYWSKIFGQWLCVSWNLISQIVCDSIMSTSSSTASEIQISSVTSRARNREGL